MLVRAHIDGHRPRPMAPAIMGNEQADADVVGKLPDLVVVVRVVGHGRSSDVGMIGERVGCGVVAGGG